MSYCFHLANLTFGGCARLALGGGGFTVEEVEQSRENDENKQAGFSAPRASGQPIRAVVTNVEQMAWYGLAMIACVGFRENDHVGVVGGSVKSNGKPQAAGTSESERPEDAIQSDAERIDPVFLWFEEEMQ